MKPDCSIKGKELYKVKSVSRDKGWWYDHRISLIDPKTFADYQTKYYKGGKHVKTIARSWVNSKLEDPRAVYWGYWYGKTEATGHETMAFIPKALTKVDHKYKKKDLWSTRTLKRMPRKIK